MQRNRSFNLAKSVLTNSTLANMNRQRINAAKSVDHQRRLQAGKVKRALHQQRDLRHFQAAFDPNSSPLFGLEIRPRNHAKTATLAYPRNPQRRTIRLTTW